MSAMYSKAFDHIQEPQNENETDYTYQDPEIAANLSSFRRPGLVGGRASAFRVKERSLKGDIAPYDEMGQSQSSSQYIDVFDSQHERGLPRQQNSITHRESEPVLRRGHQNEDSEEYCYAYAGGLPTEDEVTRRHRSVPAQRPVSLRDDYSQPPDRLSSSGSAQDYIEPYQSTETKQNLVSPVIPPDPGGIYELAKDVSDLRKSGPQDNNGVHSDHYNHLNDRLTNTNISDRKQSEERYDHVQSWTNRVMPLNSIDSGTEHYLSAQSSPQRKCSNVSDDVFSTNPTMNKTSPNMYKDLPANYEDPWDSEEGLKRFDRLMNRAEKKHETRQSFDQSSQGLQRNSVDNPGTKVQIVKKTVNQSAKIKQTGSSEVYEVAWGGKSSQRNPAPVTTPSQHKPHLPSNYEDAWDLPEKQKEFEEKLLQARKQRASQGQIREGSVTPTEENGSRTSPTTRTEPNRVIRSDSCRSLGALAEKIDTSIPLEEQSFYHGAIKRSAAERILVVFKEGSYLVRRSETSKKDFSLTLKGWNGQPMHMKIACRPDGNYVLGENSPPFSTIPDMVEYYTTHELPVQNADRICLLYPIPC